MMPATIFGDLAVQQRLPAGNRHHRRAALIHSLKASLDAQALIEDLVGIIDLAAAGAGEIATEQRLQHQHQRIALAPRQVLAEDVAADAELLQKWDAHCGVLALNYDGSGSHWFPAGR